MRVESSALSMEEIAVRTIRNMLLGAILLGAGAGAMADDYPKMNLRFAHYVSGEIPQSQVDKWWADEIERRSGGKIKIKFFWSESMGKANELVELIGSGGVELGSTAPAYYPSKLPLSGLPSSLTMAFKDVADAQRVATALSEAPAVIEENRRNGLKVLYWHTLPEYRILCTKPVASVADMKGMKMRTAGEFMPKLWGSVGAVGVNALSPEVYEGLQRGNLDCAYWPMDFMSAYKLYEAAKYLSSFNFGTLAGWPVWVNDKTWQKWPPQVRKLFEEVSAEAARRDVQMVREGSTAAEQAIGKHVKVVQFTDEDEFRRVSPDFLQLWKDSMTAKGHGDAAASLVEIVRKQLQAN
jgi:TRAP-type C4-dicarboxylate transport system substrate-binding protein